MDRIVGIDYGRKRVGVAVSDPLRIFASALETVPSAKIIDYLKKYAEAETIERFVVGYPMNLDNKPSEAAALSTLSATMAARSSPCRMIGQRIPRDTVPTLLALLIQQI